MLKKDYNTGPRGPFTILGSGWRTSSYPSLKTIVLSCKIQLFWKTLPNDLLLRADPKVLC